MFEAAIALYFLQYIVRVHMCMNRVVPMCFPPEGNTAALLPNPPIWCISHAAAQLTVLTKNLISPAHIELES